MKVLLPVDGSEYTKRMLAYLAAHDELLGPGHDYVFVTVVPPIPPHAARFLDHKVIDEYHAEQAEAVLKPVREFAEQQKWKASFRHAAGAASFAVQGPGAVGIRGERVRRRADGLAVAHDDVGRPFGFQRGIGERRYGQREQAGGEEQIAHGIVR